MQAKAEKIPPALCDFVWVDIETGGVNRRKDHIVEIGARRIRARRFGYAPVAFMSLLVRPDAPVSPEAAKVNGYSPERWAEGGAVHVRDAIRALAPLMEGARWAGQNPSFDYDFISLAAENNGITLPKLGAYRMIDTSSMAEPLVDAGLLESGGLDATAAFFNIERPSPHTALADVDVAIAVYKRLLGFFEPATSAVARYTWKAVLE